MVNTNISTKQLSWIDKADEVFSKEGPSGLKVERLAKLVEKNKSSFYHHFADLEVFTEILLDYHLEQAVILAEKEAKCSGEDAFITLMMEHKQDLLFSRQLRIHREIPEFEKCFCTTNEMSMPNFIPVWSQMIGLEANQKLAGTVLRLSIENFFLQITEDTLNPEWLCAYIANIRNMVHEFDKTVKIER